MFQTHTIRSRCVAWLWGKRGRGWRKKKNSNLLARRSWLNWRFSRACLWLVRRVANRLAFEHPRIQRVDSSQPTDVPPPSSFSRSNPYSSSYDSPLTLLLAPPPSSFFSYSPFPFFFPLPSFRYPPFLHGSLWETLENPPFLTRESSSSILSQLLLSYLCPRIPTTNH